MSSAATQFSHFLKTILYVNYMHVTLDDVTLRVICLPLALHSFCAWYMYCTCTVQYLHTVHNLAAFFERFIEPLKLQILGLGAILHQDCFVRYV